jgi:hypothetical protein
MSEDDATLVPMERDSVGLIDSRPKDAGAPRNPVDMKPRMVRVVGEQLDASRYRVA